MGNNSVPKFIFRLSRFPVYRGSVLGRFYCITKSQGGEDYTTNNKEQKDYWSDLRRNCRLKHVTEEEIKA